MLVLSIDPGTSTGWAEWHVLQRQFLRIETTTLVAGLFELRDRVARGDPPALVMFEDARRHRMGRGSHYGRHAVLQGVGSVKRDCNVWEEALELLAIPYIAAPPIVGGTKMKADTFAALTGWTGRTSNHARDAAVRAMNLNATMVQAMVAEWRQRRTASNK